MNRQGVQLQGDVTASDVLQLVQNVSSSGRYQRKLAIYFILAAFFTALPIFGSHFYYMNPAFSCQGFDGKVTEDDACQMMQLCTLKNKDTITAELGLYCGPKKKDRSFLQTAQGTGVWFGILAVSLFSDRFGKKSSYIIGVVLLNLTWVFQLIGVHLHSVLMLYAADIIMGFSTKLIYINFLVLVTRFLKKEEFEIVTLLFMLTNKGFTLPVIAGFNQIFETWRAVFWLQAAGAVWSAIAAVFVVKEDMLYLFESGQLQQATQIMKEVGEENDEDPSIIDQNVKNLSKYAEMRFQAHGEDRNGGKFNYDLRELLRCDIILNAFLFGLAGFFYMLSAKSIEFSIQGLTYGYNVNLFIVGLGIILGFSAAVYLTKIEQQRKRGLIYTTAISCIIAMLFFFSFCTENGVVETSIIFFFRFSLCSSIHFITRLQVDTFPEKYQATIIAVVELAINFAVVFGPIIVQWSIDHHINAILLVGLLRASFGIIPMFFINEKKIEEEDLVQKQENVNGPKETNEKPALE